MVFESKKLKIITSKIKTFLPLGLALILLCLLGVELSSCHKYPEGPSVTILTKKTRLCKSWKVQTATLNGDSDITAQFTSQKYVEIYDKDGEYSYSSGSTIGTGKWAFQNHSLEIKKINVQGQGTFAIYVLKLKNSEFWYWYNGAQGKIELHMTKY